MSIDRDEPGLASDVGARRRRIRVAAVVAVVAAALASAGGYAYRSRMNRRIAEEWIPPATRGRLPIVAKLPSRSLEPVPGSTGCTAFGDFDADGRSDCVVFDRVVRGDTCDSTFEVRRNTGVGFGRGRSLDAARDRPGSRLVFVDSAGDVNADGFGDVVVAFHRCAAHATQPETEHPPYQVATYFRVLLGGADGPTERSSWESALPPLSQDEAGEDGAGPRAIGHTIAFDASLEVRPDRDWYDADGDGRVDLSLTVWWPSPSGGQSPYENVSLRGADGGFAVVSLGGHGTETAILAIADFDGDGVRAPIRAGELPVDAPEGFRDFERFAGLTAAYDVDGDGRDDLVSVWGGGTWEQPVERWTGSIHVFPGSAAGVRPDPSFVLSGDANHQLSGPIRPLRVADGSRCFLVDVAELTKSGWGGELHSSVVCRASQPDRRGDRPLAFVAEIPGLRDYDLLDTIDFEGDGADELVVRDRGVMRLRTTTARR